MHQFFQIEFVVFCLFWAPPIVDGMNREIVLWTVITSILIGEATARSDHFDP